MTRPWLPRDQFAELLLIYERVLGPEHPDALTVRGNVARWTGETGAPAAARDPFAELLPVYERVMGAEHPDTLDIQGRVPEEASMDHLVVPLDLVAAMCVHSIDIYERRIIVKEIAERLHIVRIPRRRPFRGKVADDPAVDLPITHGAVWHAARSEGNIA